MKLMYLSKSCLLVSFFLRGEAQPPNFASISCGMVPYDYVHTYIVSTYCTVADYYLPATTPWDKGRLSGGHLAGSKIFPHSANEYVLYSRGRKANGKVLHFYWWNNIRAV